MFSKLTLLFLQLYTAVLCYTYHKPDKPCEFHDNECVTKMIAEFFRAAVNPDPSKGFEAIDPMHQDLVVANQPTINFTLKDSTVLGLSNLQVPSASLSDHDSVYVTLLLPYYEMFGIYEINGVFQNMPLKGNGHYSIKATNLKIYMEAMKQFFKKDDGGIYLRINRFEFTTELAGKMHVEMDNLFDGNKELADSTLKLLSSNDKMLAAVWNPPITRANLDKIMVNINKVHENVLFKDIVIDDMSKKHKHY